jgi:hypothetical protein
MHGRDPDSVDIAEAPEWLLRKIRKYSMKSSPAEALTSALVVKSDNVARKVSYSQATLEGELARLASAGEGNRNNTLNGVAYRLGQIVGSGVLDEMEVRQALLAGALKIGLPHEEVEATIKSGLGSGIKNPRIRLPDFASAVSVVSNETDFDDDAVTRQLATLGQQDADNGQRFLRRMGDSFFFCPTTNHWHAWNGKVWSPCKAGEEWQGGDGGHA